MLDFRRVPRLYYAQSLFARLVLSSRSLQEAKPFLFGKSTHGPVVGNPIRRKAVASGRKDDVAQKPATVHSQSAAERAQQEQAKARFCQGMVREAAKAAKPVRSLVRPPCCRGQLRVDYGAASTAAAVLPPVSDPPPPMRLFSRATSHAAAGVPDHRPHATTIRSRSRLKRYTPRCLLRCSRPWRNALTSRSSSERWTKRLRRAPPTRAALCCATAGCAKRRRTDTKRRTDCQSVESTGGLAIRPTAWSKYVLLSLRREAVRTAIAGGDAK